MEKLASNGDFKLVLTTLQKDYTDQLLGTEPNDKEQREFCYFFINALEAIVDTVENYGRV